MARDLLKDAQIRNAKCDNAVVRKMADGDGLYMWIYPDGRRYWRFRYWQYVPGAEGEKGRRKEKCLSLGVYPDISLAAVREKADIERKRLQEKLDPSFERKADQRRREESAENSFAASGREWLAKRSKKWSASHISDVTRRCEINLFPFLGTRPISAIEPPELLDVIRIMEKRGANDLARRVLGVAGQIFRFGIAAGRCTRNPAADLVDALEGTEEVKHQSAVAPEDVPQLMRDIAGYETKVGGDRQTMLGLFLLAMTFVRTNELTAAEWTELDLDAGGWDIPPERVKIAGHLRKLDVKGDDLKHFVPLSAKAIEYFRELKLLAGDSKYVFPGRNPQTHMSNNTLLFALYRLGYKGRMTGHGFRSVASTILNTMQFNQDAIERQLGHLDPNKIRGIYNRAKYLPDRQRIMEAWSDYLHAFINSANQAPAIATVEAAPADVSPTPAGSTVN